MTHNNHNDKPLIKKTKQIIFIFLVLTLISSVSAAAFVIGNTNLAFAKKHDSSSSGGGGGGSGEKGDGNDKGGGGSSDNSGGGGGEGTSNDNGGGGSTDNTGGGTTTEGSDNTITGGGSGDTGSGTTPPPADENTSPPPAAENQQQTVTCPDGSTADSSTGTCPALTSTPPAEQPQCPPGQHFDVNTNACVQDTPIATQNQQQQQQQQQQPAQGLSIGDIGSVISQGQDEIQKAVDAANMQAQQQSCPAGQHSTAKFGCLSDQYTLDDGTCVPGRHATGGNVCYDNKIPNPRDNTCQPGWHINDIGNECVQDAPSTPTPPPTTGERVVCKADEHYSSKQAKCVPDTDPLDDGGCAAAHHPVITDKGTLCVPDKTPIPPQQVDCTKTPSDPSCATIPPPIPTSTQTGNAGTEGTTTRAPGAIVKDGILYVDPRPSDGTCPANSKPGSAADPKKCKADFIIGQPGEPCPPNHFRIPGTNSNYCFNIGVLPKGSSFENGGIPIQTGGSTAGGGTGTGGTPTPTGTGGTPTPTGTGGTPTPIPATNPGGNAPPTTTPSIPTSTSTSTSTATAVTNVINNNKNVVRGSSGGGGGGGSGGNTASSSTTAQAPNTFLTYINALNKITIKYPSTWTKTDLVGNPSIPVIFNAPLSTIASTAPNTAGATKTGFAISITPGAASLDSFTQQQINALTHSNAVRYTITDSNAKILTPPTGITAYREVSYDAIKNNNVPLKGAAIFFVNAGTGYSLLYLAKQTDYTQNLPMVQQMVNSFQVGAAGGSTGGGPVQNVAAASSSPR
jgi:hypothetical protein